MKAYNRFRAWVMKNWVDVLITVLFLTVADVAITAADIYITKRNYDSREAAQAVAAKERAEIINANRELLRASKASHDSLKISIQNFRNSR